MTQPNPNPSQGGSSGGTSIWAGPHSPPPAALPGPYGVPGPQGWAGTVDPIAQWDWKTDPDHPTGGSNFNPGIQIDTSMASSSGLEVDKKPGRFLGFGLQEAPTPPKPPAIDHHEEGYQMGRQIGQSLMGELQGMFSQLERWFS
jgi:hypothetical protein